MTPATTPALTLNNGVTMPALGLGVFQSPPEETTAAVETALRDGYRLIDTAAAYDNEREVGDGIRRSGVDRDELFVTTKLWMSDYGHDRALVGFDASLRRLGLDRVDLYLLHQPVPTDFEATIGAYKAADSGAYPETAVVGGPVAEGGAPIVVPPVRPAVLLRAEESGGRVSVVANTVPAGAAGPFLHTHDFDEAFAVLDGELVFQLGDELVTVRGGEVAFAPRGVPHTFTNSSDSAARIAIVCTPAGFERYFARLAAERAGEEPPAWALAPIPPVTRVGPRIGERA